jgi:NhaA family Na+:H+ antiporter
MQGFSRIFRFVIDHSLLLVAGTVLALVWANVDHESYEKLAHALHFAVNDVGMVFFFALAAKEVFEATLPNGALSSGRQAGLPVLAAVGGMVAPSLLYLAFIALADRTDLSRGWAVPCATDIAFSYMVARFIFRAGSPAIPFLLLLAIADDALGLILLAVFYPTKPLSPWWFVLLMAPALVAAWTLRRQKITSFWPYVAIAGAASWFALFKGGVHPALALVPIVPFMPHRGRDIGIYDPREERGSDTMSKFEHWWKVPVQIVLGLFGFANAGVPFSQVGVGTWAVMAALIGGKPLGVFAFTWLAERFGFRRATGLTWTDVTLLGLVAGIGFTVALFFATAAFPVGDRLDEVKMGALFSFAAAPLAVALAAILKRVKGRRPARG